MKVSKTSILLALLIVINILLLLFIMINYPNKVSYPKTIEKLPTLTNQSLILPKQPLPKVINHQRFNTGNVDYIEITAYQPSENTIQKIFTNKGYVIKPINSISIDEYDFSYPLEVTYNYKTQEVEQACLDKKCFPIRSYTQVTIIKPTLCKSKS